MVEIDWVQVRPMKSKVGVASAKEDSGLTRRCLVEQKLSKLARARCGRMRWCLAD